MTGFSYEAYFTLIELNMKTTRSGISVACHWNGKFNISDMLVPAFDYCSSFKSLLTGKVLISKKSCFNEGEMLIANTKSLHIKLSQHCHRFLGDSKAHLCVYTPRHRLLLFYHNISLNVIIKFPKRKDSFPPQTLSYLGGRKHKIKWTDSAPKLRDYVQQLNPKTL